MCRLDFFVALNRPWQLIKTFYTKLWLQKFVQLTVSTWWIGMSHFAKSFSLQFCTYFRKPLLRNLFVVDRIFFGGWYSFMKIENCWKLKLMKFLQVLLIVSVTIFSDIIFRFAVHCFNQHCEQCKSFFERKIEI